MKILLGQEGVDPDRPDNNGRTPLSHAAKSACEGTELLKYYSSAKRLNTNSQIIADEHLSRMPLLLGTREW